MRSLLGIAAASTLLLAHVQATASKAETCGCGWRKHQACSISAHQFLQALQHSRVDEMCAKTDGEGDPKLTSEWDKHLEGAKERTQFECAVRSYTRKKAEGLIKCLDKEDRDSCNAEDGCEWEAQGSEECGINEFKFLKDLMGEDGAKHPLIQSLAVHEFCSGFDQQQCQMGQQASHCVWRKNECDANPALFFHILMHRPSLINMFRLTPRGAYCRAQYEHGWADGKEPQCHKPCVNEYGICRLDADSVRHFPMEADANHSAENITKNMVQVLCLRYGSTEVNGTKMCKDPCVAKSWTSRSGETTTMCFGPKELPANISKNLGFTAGDIKVAEIFMAVRSATMVYEHHCHQFNDDFDKCQASSINCDKMFKPTVAPDALKNFSGGFIGSGLNGLIGEVAQAVEEGTLPDFFENYVKHHHVMNIDDEEIKENLDLIKEWLTSPDGEWNTDTDRKSPWEKADDEDEDGDEGDLEEAFPYLLMGLGLVFAAVCGAFALGVLCTSSLAWSGGRDLRPQLLDHEAGRGPPRQAAVSANDDSHEAE